MKVSRAPDVLSPHARSGRGTSHFTNSPTLRRTPRGYLMNLLFTQGRVARLANRSIRERSSSGRRNSWHALLVVLLGCLWLNTSCQPVPSSVASLVTGETPSDPTFAGRQHFPVPPREAVECLSAIAPHEGWRVVSTGEEYSTQGIQGMFFRLEPDTPRGETRVVSGALSTEPTGASVHVSEQNGLPESVVAPLLAESKKQQRE
jgi:hypothetical protein